MAGIPYSKPVKIELRIGPESKEGRKITIAIKNKAFTSAQGVILAYMEARVPKQAGTEVLKERAISRELLPGSKELHGLLPDVSGGAP